MEIPSLCVTGASAPVFVERGMLRPWRPAALRRVTGASAPVFVERHAGDPPGAVFLRRVTGASAPVFVERRKSQAASPEE